MTEFKAADVYAAACDAKAGISSHIARTPLIASRVEPQLFFKAEQFQKTGSFKLRGAFSKLLSLNEDQPVITASSGNHGLACSYAAQKTGHNLTVVLPEHVSPSKKAKIEAFGTKIILHEGDSGKAEEYARRLSGEQAHIYVSPYNDPAIIAGQATIGLDIIEVLPEVATVYVSLGGGGLISGIGSVLKHLKPSVRVVGVSATHSAALAASIRAGRVVETEHLDTWADGCAGGVDEDAITLGIATEVIDQLIECSEAEIENALKDLAWRENMLVEGAAALAYAGYKADTGRNKEEPSVVLLCGGNFDIEKMRGLIA